MPKISDEQRAAARQRLIDATIAVAERDGVDGLTTRAIVTEAGVSAGMFYGHFDSKESLLAAVVEHNLESLTTLVNAELDLGVPLSDVVGVMLRELVTRDLRALATFRSASATPDALDAQRAINRRIVAAFTPFVEAGVAAGLVRPDLDAEAVIEVIDLAIDGLNRRRAAAGFVSDDARVAVAVLTMIDRLLLVPPGDDRD